MDLKLMYIVYCISFLILCLSKNGDAVQCRSQVTNNGFVFYECDSQGCVDAYIEYSLAGSSTPYATEGYKNCYSDAAFLNSIGVDLNKCNSVYTAISTSYGSTVYVKVNLVCTNGTSESSGTSINGTGRSNYNKLLLIVLIIFSLKLFF